MDGAARVWDAWTRIFHWALVVLVVASWWTAENGHLEWHRWSGYTILGLLIFRIYWGVFGASTARFAAFIKGPRAIGAYAGSLFGKDAKAATPGHNPLGALSVAAILCLLVAQVTLGLFAVDVDGIESGPLSHYVDFDQGRFAAEWHETTFNILLALIALHVAAIAFYAVFKRDNLIGPMITGKKAGLAHEAQYAPVWRAIPGLVIAGAIVFAVMKGLQF